MLGDALDVDFILLSVVRAVAVVFAAKNIFPHDHDSNGHIKIIVAQSTKTIDFAWSLFRELW